MTMTPLPPPAVIVFTDGSSNGRAVTLIDGMPHIQEMSETSAQRTELLAVILAFKCLSESTFNLHSDSQYIVRLFPCVETAVLPSSKSSIFVLLQQLQKEVQNRTLPFFVGCVRAHTSLPGAIHEGNRAADSLTKFVLYSNRGSYCEPCTPPSECSCTL